MWQLAQPHLPADIHPRKAMMPLAVDRYGIAEALDMAGFETVYCDLMFGLGLPIPVKGLRNLRILASLLMPVVGQLPISMLYPTGQNQEEMTPQFGRWFNYVPVIAGDFQYIRSYMPVDLRGKIIVTNTTTEPDVALLRQRGWPTWSPPPPGSRGALLAPTSWRRR